MTKPIYCESLHYKLITTLLSHKDLLWLIVHNFHNNSLFSGTWVSVCLYQIWDFCRELTRQVLDFLLTNLKVSTLPPSHCLQLSLLIKIQEFLQCHPPPPHLPHKHTSKILLVKSNQTQRKFCWVYTTATTLSLSKSAMFKVKTAQY